jgi:hypothetical protein
MSTHPTPHLLLQQIAQITRMEPGKLCVMRQGPDGPYYSLQCREEGKPVARCVPREEAELVASHTANYERFQTLVGQYVALVAAQTRAEREAGSKKKTPRPSSSWPKMRKSSN